jgi:hypothetical protein
MQGKEYLDQFKGRAFNGAGGLFADNEIRPYGCSLMDKLVPERMKKTFHRYLNSGLILGHSSYFRAVANATVALLRAIPAKCIDDQGIASWVMVQNMAPIALDYEATVFGSVRSTNYVFDDNSCKWMIEDSSWHPENARTTPMFLHHNGPKVNMLRYRDKMFECKFKGDVDKYHMFMKNQTFYMDGKEVLFTDVCKGNLSPDPYRTQPENTLLKCAREIFLYSNGTRRSFPNVDIFVSWGYSFDNVVTISCPALMRIPEGAPMKMKTGVSP